MILSEALAAPHIRHGFFTREGGYSEGLFASLNCGLGSGDDRDLVRRNRSKVAAALAVEESNLLSVYQIHSPDVVTVEDAWLHEARPKCDAMVTKEPGLALGVLTADCGPILFADRERRVIGAAHAGWKGALTGVTMRTLEAMEALGARRADIVAVIGPAISQEAYEVGPEFMARFLAEDDGNRRYFSPSERREHAMFDLALYLEERLHREGAGTVINLGICTYRDEQRFFSFRRTTHRGEPYYGRQISAIALSGE